MDFDKIKQIDIQLFDTSHRNCQYLACYKGRHFEITESVAQFITILKNNTSITEIVNQFSSLKHQKYSEEDIYAISAKCLTPILETNNKIHDKKLFLLRKKVLSKQMISPLCNHLKILFNSYLMAILCFVIICLEIYFFTSQDYFVRSKEFDIYTLFGILGLYICSSLFHELGHASACKFYGLNHGEVGLGLYMNFPVFYTDVTEIWKLQRKQRLLVNFAGVYFQTIFLIPWFIVYFVTYNKIIGFFIFTINLNFLFTLNPFFKFDGYWIVSDMLGVANLRKRSSELFNYLKNRLLHKKHIVYPYLLHINCTERIFMIGYSIIVNIFFVYYFCYIIPRFLYDFFKRFPSYLNQLLEDLSYGFTPSFDILQVTICQLIMFIITLYFLITSLYSLYKKCR